MEKPEELFTILKFPDKGLRVNSEPVKELTPEVKEFCDKFYNFFLTIEGIGLAAPQVGVRKRIVVVRLSFCTNPIILINPEFSFEIDCSKQKVYDYEGCLSVPNRTELIPRYKEIIVSFTTTLDTAKAFNLKDMDARVVQHEIDHLNGKLLLDRMESFPKDKINRLM